MTDETNFQELLSDSLPKLNFSTDQAFKWAEHLRLILEWGEKMNLTGDRNFGKLTNRHLIDCLLPLCHQDFFLPELVVDIGSGAGFPVIPWAIAMPNSTFLSIEKVRKKTEFQEHCAQKLSLRNFTCSWSRYEEEPRIKKADIIVSRAFKAHQVFLAELTQRKINVPRVLFWLSQKQPLEKKVGNYRLIKNWEHTLSDGMICVMAEFNLK